jgi:hypothetical protein
VRTHEEVTMGLVKTMGTFCYVECDMRNCSKKYEHIDEKLLYQMATLCGWEKRRDQWICPECGEKERSRKKAGRTAASRKKTEIRP